jgi:hypothetical protein
LNASVTSSVALSMKQADRPLTALSPVLREAQLWRADRRPLFRSDDDERNAHLPEARRIEFRMRPSLVPSYFRMICSRNAGARLARLS